MGEGGTVELPERVGEGVAVPVLVAAGVTDGEAPLVRDAVGDADAAELPRTVEGGAAGGVAAPEPACVGVGAPEPVAFAGAMPPSKAEPALDGLAPTESNALGRAGAVAPDPASEGDAAEVGVGVAEGVPLPLQVTVAAADVEAPGERAAVGDTFSTLLPLRITEGVGCGAPVVGAKGAAVVLHEGVALKLAPLLPLAEAARDTLAAPALLAAPGVRAAVGDAVPA